MSKIFIHSGQYFDHHFATDSWIVINDVFDLPSEKVEKGYHLAPCSQDYFSNDVHVFEGLQIAINDGSIKNEDVAIRFVPRGGQQTDGKMVSIDQIIKLLKDS